jgi:hypothetical protein
MKSGSRLLAYPAALASDRSLITLDHEFRKVK